jgi:uncharacterized protein YegJ (DUF2314 family)
MRRVLGVVAVLIVAWTGCGEKHPVDTVTQVRADDPRMNPGIDKSRSTVNTFIAASKSPKAGQSGFSVKVPFKDGANTEHIWLAPVAFDGTNFQGTVNNEPETITNVKMGQKVSIVPAKISDWMFIENGKLIGGQTLRVLRDTLTPAERADFDKNMPFVIE